MEVKKVNVEDLKPHPKNPRIHPDSAKHIINCFQFSFL